MQRRIIPFFLFLAIVFIERIIPLIFSPRLIYRINPLFQFIPPHRISFILIKYIRFSTHLIAIIRKCHSLK